MVRPMGSAWFFAWDNQRNLVVPLKELQSYKEDWIGLRTLYESGSMYFYSGKGKHMDFEQEMLN